MAIVCPTHPDGAGGYPGQSIYNPVMPFLHNLGGLYPGKMIVISGIPHQKSNRFTINLQCGASSNDDIAFHLDVRGVSTGGAIVRNTHTKGSGWGKEEKTAPCFPFSPDKFFDMIILVEKQVFKVAVNNQHLLEYSHRVPQLNRVDTLRITGDLRLTQVRLQ